MWLGPVSMLLGVRGTQAEHIKTGGQAEWCYREHAPCEAATQGEPKARTSSQVPQRRAIPVSAPAGIERVQRSVAGGFMPARRSGAWAQPTLLAVASRLAWRGALVPGRRRLEL